MTTLQNAQDGVHTLVLANKCDITPEERDVSKDDIINVRIIKSEICVTL